VHYLLTHLHSNDAHKSGKFSFNELLVIFRAVAITYPGGGRVAAGFAKLQVSRCILVGGRFEY
jgi:hypothetical protein